jgi:hypothetical protein
VFPAFVLVEGLLNALRRVVGGLGVKGSAVQIRPARLSRSEAILGRKPSSTPIIQHLTS